MLLPLLPPANGHRRRGTIDDPAVANQLRCLLRHQPFGFLAAAAGVVELHAGDVAGLMVDLARANTEEAIAMACAVAWLTPPEPPTVVDQRLPRWLAQLDGTEVRTACYRRDGPDWSFSQYLLAVELVDGRHGTVAARIDHELHGALSFGFALDCRIQEAVEAVLVADRLSAVRARSGSPGRAPRPFEAIQPLAAQRALAAAVHTDAHLVVPLDLSGHRPRLRPLLSFVALDLGLEPP